jgi:hypothetical protein
MRTLQIYPDRMNMDDRYETGKIVGIELISEWDSNVRLQNQTIWPINRMHTLSITLGSLFSYLSLIKIKHLDPLIETV